MSKNGKTWAVVNPNSVLYADDDSFYISYNPGNYTMSMWSSDDGGPETAIVANDQYFILNGDHREAYEKLLDKGIDACLGYFEKHKSQKSKRWSD